MGFTNKSFRKKLLRAELEGNEALFLFTMKQIHLLKKQTVNTGMYVTACNTEKEKKETQVNIIILALAPS